MLNITDASVGVGVVAALLCSALLRYVLSAPFFSFPSFPSYLLLFSSCFCGDYRQVGSFGVVPLAEAAATDCLIGSRVQAPVSVAFVKNPPKYLNILPFKALPSSDDAAAAVFVAGFTTCSRRYLAG